MLLTFTCCLDTLGKAGCARLMLLDYLPAVQALGYDRMVIRLDGKKIVDIAALGKQHQIAA